MQAKGRVCWTGQQWKRALCGQKIKMSGLNTNWSKEPKRVKARGVTMSQHRHRKNETMRDGLPCVGVSIIQKNQVTSTTMLTALWAYLSNTKPSPPRCMREGQISQLGQLPVWHRNYQCKFPLYSQRATREFLTPHLILIGSVLS